MNSYIGKLEFRCDCKIVLIALMGAFGKYFRTGHMHKWIWFSLLSPLHEDEATRLWDQRGAKSAWPISSSGLGLGECLPSYKAPLKMMAVKAFHFKKWSSFHSKSVAIFKMTTLYLTPCLLWRELSPYDMMAFILILRFVVKWGEVFLCNNS